MSRPDLIDIACTLHMESERAILVSNDGAENNAVWLPKSQVAYETNRKTGIVIVTMNEWLAMEKGLI